MSVNITALDDLGQFDDLGVALWKRIVSDIATAGTAELYWNKKSRNALKTAVKQVGKVSEKAYEKVLCPVADNFKQGPAAEAAMKSGYGIVAVVASNAVSNTCPKGKKKDETPVVAAVVVESHWYDNPWAVGGVGLAAGVLLGAMFSRGRH